MLKRVAFGVYEARTNPDDRGVRFRGGKSIKTLKLLDDGLYGNHPVSEADADLNSILDDVIGLTARINYALCSLQQAGEVFPELKSEMKSIHMMLLQRMDTAVTDLTALMAWCEDHSDELAIGMQVQAYLQSDKFNMDFTRMVMETSLSKKKIRETLIGQRRASLEQNMEREQTEHTLGEALCGETETDSQNDQKYSEEMMHSW